MRTGKSVASKLASAPMPPSPATMRLQLSSRPTASGVSRPTPVTATRAGLSTIEYLRVQAVRWLPTFEHGDHIVHRQPRHFHTGRLGRARDVRRDDDIVEAVQRVVRR